MRQKEPKSHARPATKPLRINNLPTCAAAQKNATVKL
jgi:hypothetical protein